MADQVEFLVMSAMLERAQAGGDGIVAARLDADVIGGIGTDQVDGCSRQQPIDVVGIPRVPREKPMISQEPKVSRLGDGLVRRLGNVVGVGLAGSRAQELAKLIR